MSAVLVTYYDLNAPYTAPIQGFVDSSQLTLYPQGVMFLTDTLPPYDTYFVPWSRIISMHVGSTDPNPFPSILAH